MDKKKVIACIVLAAVLAAAVYIGYRILNRSEGDADAAAYVDIAENYTPFGALGSQGNYYTGTVAAQETWSVSLESESRVKELLVSVGDEVEEGQDLFIYDTEEAEAELEQLDIELIRLNNELTNLETSIGKLETERNNTWDSSDRADYDLRIQETELEIEEKKLDIEAKENQIAKKKEGVENSVVKSRISGTVSRISDPDSSSAGSFSDNDSDNAYITVVRTGDLQVRGSASEMNIWDLSEGMDVLVYSRVDDSSWHGTITKIEYNDPITSENSMGESSTKYPFFVQLDSTEGLMLGQHVYLTRDMGQNDPKMQEGIWLYQYMVDETSDPGHPFVWADNGGKLIRKEVVIGGRDEELGLVQITEGLELTDYIAQPEEGLKEGMTAVTMGEMISGSGTGTAISDEGEPEEVSEEEYSGEEPDAGEEYISEDAEPDEGESLVSGGTSDTVEKRN